MTARTIYVHVFYRRMILQTNCQLKEQDGPRKKEQSTYSI